MQFAYTFNFSKGLGLGRFLIDMEFASGLRGRIGPVFTLDFRT
jgi:hypothetical protein